MTALKSNLRVKAAAAAVCITQLSSSHLSLDRGQLSTDASAAPFAATDKKAT